MVASSHCSNMVFCVALRRESIMALCSPSVMESARAALLELWSLLVAFHHTNKHCQLGQRHLGALPVGGVANWALPIGLCQSGIASWGHCQLGASPVGAIANGLCQLAFAKQALPSWLCQSGVATWGRANWALPVRHSQLGFVS